MSTNLVRMRMVRIEETHNWSEDTVKQTGRIWTWYAYNEHEATYCCEITPSRYLYFINNEFENEVSEDLYDELMQQENDGIYVHCRVIDKFKCYREDSDYQAEDEQDYKDYIDRYIENAMGNPCEARDLKEAA